MAADLVAGTIGDKFNVHLHGASVGVRSHCLCIELVAVSVPLPCPFKAFNRYIDLSICTRRFLDVVAEAALKRCTVLDPNHKQTSSK